MPVDYESISKLAPCLLKLCEKYFKSKRASRGSLVIINLVPTPKSFLQRRMLEKINEDKSHALGVMVKDGRLKHLNASAWGVTDKAQSYLLLMLVHDDLVVTVKQWKSLPTWNPLAQTVIVFMDPIQSVEIKDASVKKVLDTLLSEGMINAIVMYQIADDDERMVAETWFPYLNKSCATSIENIYIIDECVMSATNVNGTIDDFNTEYFPRIPTNFRGCPINVSAFFFEPYVAGSPENTAGLEIQMLKTITTQMNMKINYNFLDKKLLAAKIKADNKTGIYADLIQK